MSYRTTLKQEIHAILNDLEAKRLDWHQKFIAARICESHTAGLRPSATEHAEFWAFCGYEAVMDVIGVVIKQRTGEADDGSVDEQYVLPGFKYAHAYYRIERMNSKGKMEPIVVHIDTMSRDEIEAKAKTYRAQASTMEEHARELDIIAMTRPAATA